MQQMQKEKLTDSENEILRVLLRTDFADSNFQEMELTVLQRALKRLKKSSRHHELIKWTKGSCLQRLTFARVYFLLQDTILQIYERELFHQIWRRSCFML